VDDLPAFLLPATAATLETEDHISRNRIESRINGDSSSTPFSPAPRQKGSLTELEEMQFEILFERALEMVMAGNALSEMFKDDIRGFSSSRFLKWIHTDRTRQSRYYEAQSIGAELVADQMITIADAENSLEDINRSKLRIDTRKFLIGVWNRKRFGEVKQVELNTSISITDALAEARGRVIEHSSVPEEVIEEVTTFISHESEQDERSHYAGDEDDY